MKLKPKTLHFISEYLIDGNGKRAAIAAGFTERSAESTASRMLRNAKVQSEIQTRMEQRAKKSEFTVREMMTRLDKIYQRCMEAEPVLDKEGKQTGEWKFDSRGALRSVELMGKHLGMFQDAATQVHVHNERTGAQPIDLSEASTLELMEALLYKGGNGVQVTQATGVHVFPAPAEQAGKPGNDDDA